MAFINESGVIASVLAAGTLTITGNLFLSLLVVFLFLLVAVLNNHTVKELFVLMVVT